MNESGGMNQDLRVVQLRISPQLLVLGNLRVLAITSSQTDYSSTSPGIGVLILQRCPQKSLDGDPTKELANQICQNFDVINYRENQTVRAELDLEIQYDNY